VRTDVNNWMPLSVSEVVETFSGVPFRWCIAGGWALDLHLGRQSRTHADIDIFLFREDQLAIFNFLSKNWLLYKADHGMLTLWEKGDYLTSVNDVWVSKDKHSPWVFQIMLVDIEHGLWIYKRNRSIRRALRDLCSTTSKGIPYLKPEIQLLYKGGSSEIREKDHQDFIAVLPSLLPQAREWLISSLRTQFPEGHPWIHRMESGG
jgi:hypothetical protein